MTSKSKHRSEAFDALVRAYESRLLRYATRLTSDAAAAEDLVQETFLKLLRRWKGTLEPAPGLLAWLYRVLHNEAIDHLRRESRRRRLHRQNAEETPSDTPPDRGFGTRVPERARIAGEALAILTPRERNLVVLKVFEERSYREIAELTGLRPGNIGFILHHAMRKLARHLEKSNGSESTPS